ncbi:hypothetical protein LRP50_16835 [Enterovibrio sp. ZSDZ42]|uniref:Uncharacterized protein n=1 Tax=Enterovibrio gelatinilyticus TaxID=2899819 RepID=A0ABT5R3F9_9GAMM|nr:hypothetical protein [Enterovibrio sp. ZSDZ42]MDD1794803.1 hypothetical protein [Enterovibrio sp. ZSDZ42]
MKLEFNHKEYLEIRSSDHGTAGIGYDCQLTLGFQSEYVQGQTETWVDGPEMEQFIEQLRMVEKTLSGEATLSATSPDELLIELTPIDLLGHYSFKIKTGHRYFVHSKMSIASAEAEFPVYGQQVIEICISLASYFESKLSA